MTRIRKLTDVGIVVKPWRNNSREQSDDEAGGETRADIYSVIVTK